MIYLEGEDNANVLLIFCLSVWRTLYFRLL